jgi:hypothetical protein
MTRPLKTLSLVLAIASLPAAPVSAVDDVAGGMITFKQNGGWCWFSNDAVIVHNDQLIIGSVAGVTNSFGTGGDIQMTIWNRATQSSSQTILAPALQRDDHNNPSFLVRPDGKLLVTYQKHGGDDLLRWRISNNTSDFTSLGAERSLDVNPNNDYGNTYSNLYYLPAENRVYNFSRAVGYDPNFSYSTDLGETFTYGDRHIIWNNTNGGGRPYARYASNKIHRIWFQITDDHPRNYGNSIYTGYMQGGNMYNATGTLLGPLYTPGVTGVQPSSFTKVYAGDNNHRGWTTDIEIDKATGNPFMAFSVREIVNNVTTLKYYYSRFDGSAWQTNPLAYAGNYLYAAENDYTGLVALDPNDPNTLFISTDVDPATGASIGTGKHEIYKGITADGGATWNWLAITSNSTVDNIRPIVPDWDSKERALLWLRGTYNTYTDYNMAVVGQIHYEPGDTNGDRNVNFDDLLTLAQNYGLPGNPVWANGDFTGDGIVGFDDLLLLAQHYDGATGLNSDQSLAASFAADWAAAQSLVPEPGSVLMALVVASPGTRRLRC